MTTHAATQTEDDSPLFFELERRADPLAIGVYRALQGRSLADQLHVLAALQDRFPYEPSDQRKARAVEALRIFWQEQQAAGRSTVLGKKPYTRWRAEQPKHLEYPAASTIAQAFGGWELAARAADHGLPADLRATRSLAISRFSEEEILAAIEIWASDQPEDLRLTEEGFLAWTRRETDTPSGRVGRVPLTGGPIQRLGGWRRFLSLAGLADRAGSPATKGQAIITRTYSDEDLIEMLREAAETRSGKEFPLSAFTVWREQQLKAGHHGIPSVITVINRFGSWNLAKVAAGLAIDRERLAFHPAPYPIAEMKAAVRLAAEKISTDRLTKRHYERWREQQMEADPDRRLPAGITIAMKLGEGSWTAACHVCELQGKSYPRFTAEQARAALAEVIEATGDPKLSMASYKRYREGLDDPERLPSHTTVMRRLGDERWTMAREQARSSC